MRQIVAILLNEREQSKKRVADQLERLLAAHGITSSRIEPGPQMERRIREMQPAILVLDYLLGDHGTGLDVLHQISLRKEDERPRCFFLTDEPSISVAVESMRLGAENYFEIDQPNSVQLLLKEIEKLKDAPLRTSQEVTKPKILSDLVASDRRSQAVVAHAKSLAVQLSPLVIVCGPSGSGRSCFAEALVSARPHSQPARIIDFRFFSGPIERVVPASFYSHAVELVPSGFDLLIEHVDEDTELLEFFLRERRPLSRPHRVLLTMSSLPSAQAWVRSLGAELLVLESLNDRADDIAPLAQLFVREASALHGTKLKTPPAADLKELTRMRWEGNVRELRSAIFSASWLPNYGESFIDAVRHLKDQDTAHRTSERLDLAPESIRAFLATTGLPERAAAARLGCSVAFLRSALRGDGI